MDFITDPNLKLSKNWTAKEFACRCCGRIKIDTEHLIPVLQNIRDIMGVVVYCVRRIDEEAGSGYRCARRNKAQGGARNSHHMSGRAADIWCPGASYAVLRKAVSEAVKREPRAYYIEYTAEHFFHVGIR